MGFRKTKNNPESQWIKKNYSRLVDAGLSTIFLDDENKWNYVLLHGYDEFDTGWSIDNLTDEQCCNLLDLLKEFYKDDIGLDLISDLRRRVQKDS